ncbi:SUKH-4 family immunity protein [Streptomyces sp. NPDC020965]|uniref:SUKH-4 family immunity protein n=1 Tax=Streptomyces sp. NPDC020965 TaxID=3365105 RepID=UPI00379F64B9
MVTFAQAQERAEEWVNGDVPTYQQREVRVREFELGFVVWAEDRESGARSDGGRQRLVIARDSGEATLWPGLPVGEVIRRYEEEYGVPADGAVAPPEPPRRIDLHQTSFLLSPPEWLQDEADRRGAPGGTATRAGRTGHSPASDSAEPPTPPPPPVAPPFSPPAPPPPSPASSSSAVSSDAGSGSGAAVGVALPPLAGAAPPGPVPDTGSSNASQAGGGTATGDVGVDSSQGGAVWANVGGDRRPTPAGGTPASWTDTSSTDAEDASVPLPDTVFAAPVPAADESAADADAPTALMSGGSQLPPTAVNPALKRHAPAAAAGGERSAPGGDGTVAPPPGPPAPRGSSGAGAAQPAPLSAPGASGVPAGGYLPTQLSAQPVPDDSGVSSAGEPSGPPPAPGPMPPPASATPPGPPTPPGPAAASGNHPMPPSTQTPPPVGPTPPVGSTPPPVDVHHAATVLAGPGPTGPGVPRPPGPPGPPPAVPQPPGPPAVGATPPPGQPPVGSTPPPVDVHHAATVLAGPGAPQPPAPPSRPGPPGAPGPPPGSVGRPTPYGYPQQQTGVPTVGPGYQAVLRYRAPDGSEAQLIRRSAPGTPHPEWQILHELRALNVPPQQVLELHTELESCELPGGYCARMIRETWPQARITHIAPYGKDHAGRQQGMGQLVTHQGELHQVADGPARPAPVRAPLPQVPPAPPLPPQGVAQELVSAFGPQGICRFDQRAVSRQGVPELVAATLMWAGLPGDFNPFFWAQPAQPVVPTLAELAAQRQVATSADATSYLVVGSDFGRAICVQYGTAHIVAVPVEAPPGGGSAAPQFVNSGLPEFVRCMALLGRMWRLRYGLNPEQAGRWTVDFQAQLASLDPVALSSPENWWSVLLEQMWDGLL